MEYSMCASHSAFTPHTPDREFSLKCNVDIKKEAWNYIFSFFALSELFIVV